ncbi:hypothetical protein SDC9_179196 [bioreactor metagenome]|uniref:Uncharacterized protein n=1 Tax=bioreactor metagenome TaxID=1076179 RepID=A0A645H0A2_9ZZZZ
MSAFGEFGEHVRDERWRVAVSQGDLDLEPVSAYSLSQCVPQSPVLLVDRAHAAKSEVVLSDLDQAFRRDAATGCDAFEEWHHLVDALRSAETEKQNGVEARAHRKTRGSSATSIRRPV